MTRVYWRLFMELVIVRLEMGTLRPERKFEYGNGETSNEQS